MKLLFQKTMSSARFWTVVALITCALPSTATTIDYQLIENVPCQSGCGRFLAVEGDITVNALGALNESNIISWDILIQYPGGSPVDLTESDSTFLTLGSPQITATNIDLTVVAPPGSSILFGSIAGQLVFSGSPSGYTVVYGDHQATGFKAADIPATMVLPLNLGGPTPVPEPNSSVAILLSIAVLFPALKRIQSGTGVWTRRRSIL